MTKSITTMKFNVELMGINFDRLSYFAWYTIFSKKKKKKEQTFISIFSTLTRLTNVPLSTCNNNAKLLLIERSHT